MLGLALRDSGAARILAWILGGRPGTMRSEMQGVAVVVKSMMLRWGNSIFESGGMECDASFLRSSFSRQLQRFKL